MRLLAFDCSTDTLIVAARGDTANWSHTEGVGSGASARILPWVQKALGELQWRGTEIDAIVFGAGPGSFTGPRSACGIAQGLALAWDCPVIPVSSFQAVAMTARRHHTTAADALWVVLDARMGEAYVAAMIWDGEQWLYQAPPQVLKPAAVIAQILAGPRGRLGCGSGFAAYPQLGEALSAHLTQCDASSALDETSLIDVGERAWRSGGTVAVDEALPLYVRDKVAMTTLERGARVARNELTNADADRSGDSEKNSGNGGSASGASGNGVRGGAAAEGVQTKAIQP